MTSEDFENVAYGYVKSRYESNTAHLVMLLSSDTSDTPPQSSDEASNAPVAEAASSSSAAPQPAASSETEDFRAKVALQAAGYRWHEEAVCRAALDHEITWTDKIPWTDEHESSQHMLARIVRRYIESWQHQLMFAVEGDEWPRSLRVYAVECAWCFAEMYHRGCIPWNLWNPHDRFIREQAAACPHGQQDYGNMAWEDVVCILQLTRYINPTRRSHVGRVPPAEYGAASQKSAVGVINLRGNILEAVLSDVQARATSEQERHDPVRRWQAHDPAYTKGKSKAPKGRGKGGGKSKKSKKQ